MNLALSLAGAYAMGSIPTSYIAGRLGAGIDLREHGSRNLGATNVFRVLGWKYAVPVGAFDIFKGAFPVFMLSPRAGTEVWVPLAIGVTVILGHVFSIFVRFRGGKGVATAAGVLLALAPVSLAIAVAVWGLVVWATGYVSLGSISAALSFPVSLLLTQPGDRITFAVCLAIAVFIVFNHRSNIRRLVAGTESRFSRGRPSS